MHNSTGSDTFMCMRRQNMCHRVLQLMLNMARKTQVRFVRERDDLDAEFTLRLPPHHRLIDLDAAPSIRKLDPNADDLVAQKIGLSFDSKPV